MANSTTKILVGAAVVVGLWAWLKVRALGNLIVAPGQIYGMSFVGSTPVMELSVRVQNTSSTDLLINSFAGNVYANGTMVGNAKLFQPVAVPGNHETEVNMFIEFRLLGIVNEIIRAFQTKSFTQAIEIEGFANLASFQLPVKLDFQVGKT